MEHADVVVVGAGHAGAHAAMALRKGGFSGSVALVDGEPEIPYEKPPLSKDYLSGERSHERILMRPAQFWNQSGITLLTGHRVTAVHPGPGSITLDDDRTLRFGHLIWAGGGTPRPLPCPGGDLPCVHYLRTRMDADRIRQRLDSTSRAVIIGAGYIGLEAAATLAKAGKSVTVIEASNRVLARVTGIEISGFMESAHRQQGVELLLSEQVVGIEQGTGLFALVNLASGASIPADLIIAGIGIEPAVSPLLGAGAVGSNGIQVDSHCRTSLPNISAIGDCALHANPYAEGRWIRLESVQNATDMASVVAKSLLGTPEPYTAVPWFWSNQYDLRLQTVGIHAGHDSTEVAGDPATRQFSVRYLKEGHVIAVDCVNSPRDFMAGKTLVSRLMGDRSRPHM